MSEDMKRLVKQNEFMISLLGRIAFKKNEVREIVTKRKEKPQNYINGYNACDGEKSFSEIAKIVGVKGGTLSPIMKEWEEQGIVFEIEKPGGKFYKKLFPI